MIDLTLPIIGPTASILEAVRELGRRSERLAILLDGNPGIAKSHILDLFSLELTGSKFAIETVNGQSLGVELVRDWRERAGYGNLFSAWTVKRVDELDKASSSATAELLTYLDYLPPRVAVLVTTNDYPALRASSKGRLETRFVRYHVDPPSVEECAKYLRSQFKVPASVAREIATGAVPDGCLPSEGCNMRAAVEDAKGYLAARYVAAKREAA